MMAARGGVLPRSGSGADAAQDSSDSDEDEPAVGRKRATSAKPATANKKPKAALQRSSEGAVQQKVASGKAGAGNKKVCPSLSVSRMLKQEPTAANIRAHSHPLPPTMCMCYQVSSGPGAVNLHYVDGFLFRSSNVPFPGTGPPPP
jgi:hypothetical protein